MIIVISICVIKLKLRHNTLSYDKYGKSRTYRRRAAIRKRGRSSIRPCLHTPLFAFSHCRSGRVSTFHSLVRCSLYLDLATGLRRGELLGLKWTDVDFDRGVLKIQRAISRQNGKVVEAPLKTKNAYRTLPLSADAISVLKMQKCKVGNSKWAFPSPSGGPMSPDSVLHMLQRVLKRAGLPRIRFHDLRHPYVKHTTKK